MDFGKFRSFRGNLNADMEDGDMRKSSRATSTPQYYKYVGLSYYGSPTGYIIYICLFMDTR